MLDHPASSERELSVAVGERIRVLHCLWSGEVGGTERAVYQLVREQMKDPGLEPALLFARSQGVYWEKAGSLGCTVVTLGLPHGHAVGRLPHVAAAMRGFDIHHFHSAEPLLMFGSARCRGAGRVYTHRGGLIDYPFAKRLQYEASGVILRRYFSAFSGNTAHAARSAARLYRLPEDRFRLTYNGLDFDLLTPDRDAASVRSELALSSDDFVLGTAANLKPWKRIERLVDAVAALSDSRLRLVILGQGPERARLEDRVRQYAISSQVVFAGLQPHPGDYLQVMDAFCLPSMGLESFGNAAVEAMAQGIPTIVFADGGGLVEHIQDRETGFVVSNQAELELTIRRLIADDDLREHVGANGRRAVRERYSSATAARSYRSLYTEALAMVSSRRR
jgi:glycosyltransferase involved in cell wall biosynthesis